MNDQPLVFAHIGDLHITKAREQNYIDYLSIVSQIEEHCSRWLDFVFLPGDNADNGLAEQYNRVSIPLKMLSVPVHVIPGDHDMEQHSLSAFYTLPCAEQLPKIMVKKGTACLFLDISGGGKGGPDFTIGAEQMSWLEDKLATAQREQWKSLIFMHTYPDDLTNLKEAERFNELVAKYDVLFVGIGHTHYNEIANDGATVYAATRSTGQIEEGPAGFTLAAVDGDNISWRFKPLQDAFPFVLITSPADHRLFRPAKQSAQQGIISIRAVVFGARKITEVFYSLNELDLISMVFNEDGQYWQGDTDADMDAQKLTVKAVDETGRPGFHTIILPHKGDKKKSNAKRGSDAYTIGAWPENGIFGTQLGPNRNGKPS